MTEPTKIRFAIQSFDISEESNDPKFAYAKIQAFSSQGNRHNLYCSEDTLKKTAPTIYETPIIYNWDKGYFNNDFGTHTDPEKSMIAGFVIPNSATFERLPDSRLTLTVSAKLWKNYIPNVLSVLKDKDGFSKVSVEMNLLDSAKMADGVFEMKDFEYLGVCLLGDKITEAVPGANIQMLTFAEAKSEFELSLKEDFAKSIDLSIPKSVKDNVNKGLELHKKYGIGGSSVSLASARHISSNDIATPEKVKYLHKVHKSNNFKNMTKSPPSDSYIRFLLHGGQEGAEWSTKIMSQLEESDNLQNAYFTKVTFPYTSLKDINPALKGLDGLTLEQANAIARQADAIGGEYGWPTAISSFKKRHVHKDGKWVEKENMADTIDDEDETNTGTTDGNTGKENTYMEDEKVKEEKAKEEEMAVAEKKTPKEEKVEEKKEDPKEEKTESPTEEKKEEKEEDKKEKMSMKMSLDAYLDVAAMLAFLEDETESYQELVAEFEKEPGQTEWGKVMAFCYGKFCKMAADMKTCSEENMSLKEFKASIEKQEYEFAVNSTIKEIEATVEIPKDDVNKLLDESKKYTLSTVDAWKNFAKATAFNFAKKVVDTTEKESRIGLYWQNLGNKTQSGTVWDRLK